MVKCPYCGYDECEVIKTWKFRFYNVEMLQCPKCNGIFNYYKGVSSKGKWSEYVIRVKPKVGKK